VLLQKKGFAVSGQFRKALNDLITDLHNSNKKLVQVTLGGKILFEEKFCLLGFVPSDVINLLGNIWFSVLSPEQTNALSQYVNGLKHDNW